MDDTMDPARGSMLDGNAAAGALRDIFGAEMTAAPAECASCGNVAELGALDAWMDGPGIVLRCPVCGQVVIRIVDTPHGRYLDARGAVYVRLAR